MPVSTRAGESGVDFVHASPVDIPRVSDIAKRYVRLILLRRNAIE
jgi:hypothetical protein